MTSWAAARQREIYARGKGAGSIPASFQELEKQASGVLSREAFDFIAGGAGGEETLRDNRRAFEKWKILPRTLRGVTQPSLSTRLFERELPFPVLLAPIGVQRLVHPEGESATCRAAAALNFPAVLSTVTSSTLEEQAELLGQTERWFQLYWGRDREIVASLVKRAEASGYSVIVVTVDATHPGWRERDLENAFLPYLNRGGLGNYFTDPAFRRGLSVPPEEDPEAALKHFSTLFNDPSLSWKDLDFLRHITNLPILLKGILSRADAREALDMGLDGIIVSNHGGRQLDGSIAALDALPPIVEQVEGAFPVLLDSGIRRGSDVLRALALGANAVLLGRPFVYGLALGGEQGVKEVLLNFLADLELSLALSGCESLSSIGPDLLYRVSP